MHLLFELAGLKIEKEHDLISLAQFHVNERKSSAGLAKKILQEFSEQAEVSAVHEILARLPIGTFWTTNYDSLIEDALKQACKVADVKHSVSQMNTTRPKRDAVVYKMHGDVTVANEAVIYKQQYECYYKTHAPFITALSGDLVSKTFLFIGFSFTDPNLDYILSRLHSSQPTRQHYCFMRKEVILDDDDAEIRAYKARKQALRVDDLKRFGVQTLLVDEYTDIPRILEAIEIRFRKKTIFISGSAEEFGNWSRQDGQEFTHALAAGLVREGFRVVNGFGWGIGSAVINGALEAIYANPEKLSEDQLVMRPFPQFATSSQNLPQLWEEYRQRMISLAGIAIFVFGNKQVNGNIVEANGVVREFEIACQHGLVSLPVGATGYAAKTIYEKIKANPPSHTVGNKWLESSVDELADTSRPHSELVKKLVHIVKQLNR